jgi:hypothetical protein
MDTLTKIVTFTDQRSTSYVAHVGPGEDEDGAQYAATEVASARTSSSITIRISALPPSGKTAKIPWHLA